VAVFNAIWSRLRRRAVDDSGVAALLIAGAIAIIAFTGLSIYLNKYVGDRKFAQATATSSRQSLVVNALTARYLSNGTAYKLPCPDTDYDGVADEAGVTSGTCDDQATVFKGVVPWLTLGLSRDDVVDAYGNFYTYLLSGTANGYNATTPASPRRGVCDSVTSDYTGTTEFTGSLLSSDIELLETTQTAGQNPLQGRRVPFVLVSHGLNGLGATSLNGHAQGAASATYEALNAGANPAAVYSGPYNNGNANASAYFDDLVYALSLGTAENLCKQLTPGGRLNADIGDNFNNPTVTGQNFANLGTNGVTTTTAIGSSSNKVASFAGAGSYLATTTTSTSIFDLDPQVRPIYISARWTPNPSYVAATGSTHATTAGISFATRATAADLAAGTDEFSAGTAAGITFRFYSSGAISGAGSSNTISIFEHDGAAAQPIATTATPYDLISNETYLLEAFDDGTNVWMRITQEDDITNTVTIRGTSAADHTGNQQVLFINGPSDVSPASYLDDIAIGFPMLALETDGDGDVAYSAAATNGTATGSITVEAWIRPHSLPAINNISTIIAQWDTASVNTSSYRLYLDAADGMLKFQDAGTFSGGPNTETFNTGIVPALDTWSHVAITFDASGKSIRSYLNSVLVRVGTSATTVGTGIRASAAPFTVGAGFSGGTGGTVVDGFEGAVSDVRVWSDVRTANEIATYFERRLPVAEATTNDTAILANLAVNWKLDRESGGLAQTTALATPSGYGVSSQTFLGNAQYTPTLSLHFRPFSRDFCPAGTVYSIYKCDFRPSAQTAAGQTFTMTIPSNLAAVFAKVWGGGGGGYFHQQGMNQFMSAGGGGGFSEGLIESVDNGAIPVAGAALSFEVGGYGTGSVGVLQGAGGGGASGIRSATPRVIMSAGGGGGASYSEYNPAGPTNACNTLVGSATLQCGLGGGGGGATALATSHAPDASTNCGGRGGNNGSFIGDPDGTGSNAGCPDGGADPSTTTGGNGGGTALGGSSLIGAGGRGYNGSSGQRPGGGGGGGGASNFLASAGGGEAGGYDDGSNYTGYGGGGGAGFADSGVSNQNGALGAAPSAGAASTDFYYSPSYLSSMAERQNPGRGGLGTSSAAVNGRTGAITILW